MKNCWREKKMNKMKWPLLVNFSEERKKKKSLRQCKIKIHQGITESNVKNTSMRVCERRSGIGSRLKGMERYGTNTMVIIQQQNCSH